MGCGYDQLLHSGSNIGRDLGVDLAGAYIADESRLSANRYRCSVERSGRIYTGKIGACPCARIRGEIRSMDLDPGTQSQLGSCTERAGIHYAIDFKRRTGIDGRSRRRQQSNAVSVRDVHFATSAQSYATCTTKSCASRRTIVAR